jgi:predicted nucleotidyltransferase
MAKGYPNGVRGMIKHTLAPYGHISTDAYRYHSVCTVIYSVENDVMYELAGELLCQSSYATMYKQFVFGYSNHSSTQTTMATITEPVQTIGGNNIHFVSAKVLPQSEIISTASSIIRTYPSFTSAYLFGSYAKGNARPDSDIDIALFLPKLNWGQLRDIGGVHMDLEASLGKKIDLSVCPPDDFVEKIKTSWLPIDIGVLTGTVSFSLYIVAVFVTSMVVWSIAGVREHSTCGRLIDRG